MVVALVHSENQSENPSIPLESETPQNAKLSKLKHSSRNASSARYCCQIAKRRPCKRISRGGRTDNEKSIAESAYKRSHNSCEETQAVILESVALAGLHLHITLLSSLLVNMPSKVNFVFVRVFLLQSLSITQCSEDSIASVLWLVDLEIGKCLHAWNTAFKSLFTWLVKVGGWPETRIPGTSGLAHQIVDALGWMDLQKVLMVLLLEWNMLRASKSKNGRCKGGHLRVKDCCSCLQGSPSEIWWELPCKWWPPHSREVYIRSRVLKQAHRQESLYCWSW